MTKNKWIAGGVAVIISAAEIVIIYELWLAGTWLLESAVYGDAISSAKTASFILLFVGSLLAEMQELNKGTKRLLFGVVCLLGIYQTAINWTVNYYGANIPQRILDLFAPVWSVTVTEIAYSGFDAITRSLVVVLMWLVAGQLWRGVALIIADTTKETIAELQATVTELQQRNEALLADNKHGETWDTLSQTKRTLAINLLDAGGHLNGDRAAVMTAAKREFGSDKVSRTRIKK